MTIKQTAQHFFDACETGKGWDTCKQWCHAQATFSAQLLYFAKLIPRTRRHVANGPMLLLALS